MRLFSVLIYWDVLREVRRKETLPNMCFFALLILFVCRIGLGGAVVNESGPVVLLVATLFAGTVGLSQSFSAERESGALSGMLAAPMDLGLLYLAKVFATWLYVMIMELFLLGAYVLLFNFDPAERWLGLCAVLAVYTLAYVAPGVVLAAMTTSLRGRGEVVLRLLLFPLMIPVSWLTLQAASTIFDVTIATGQLGRPLSVSEYLPVGLAFDAIYLVTGFLIFPKVLEE